MRKYYFLVAALFICLIILETFPLVFNLNRYIPGFFSTDESFAPLWESWRLGYSFHHQLSLRSTNLVAYPFGVNLYPSGYISYLWFGLNFLLGLLVQPALAYNIQVLANIFLSGIFSYFLVYYITSIRLSAIFSGIIFAFCPYQSVRSWQHLGLTFNQWIPLVIFLAIRLKNNDSKKNQLFFLLSLFLLFSFDWSVIFLTMAALFSFLIYYMVLYNWRAKFFRNRQGLAKLDFAYLRKVFFIGLAAFLIFLPQFLPAIKGRLSLSKSTPASVFSLVRRPFEDLFSQSARPLSYFLPASVHPVFGKFTENFIGTSLYGESLTEHTLYLGWVPLILAFVAFGIWRKKRKLSAISYQLSAENFYIGFFIFLALGAWFFSQPPWWQIGTFKIYMPSFFIYKIIPMFRAYCRFGIVVMLAVAVLAGFGLKIILEGFKTRKTRIAITVLFCSLALFEFWNWPPYKVIDVSRAPGVYYWLKRQPADTVIAEYPLDLNGSNELHKYFQTVHEKRIINGTIPGSYANKVSREIIKLSNLDTPRTLKWLGVNYVLVHRDEYLNSGLVGDLSELERIPKNSNLKLIRTFPEQVCLEENIMCVQNSGAVDVYEITASVPLEPKAKRDNETVR